MTPKVSIITPSYNQGQFIERTIQSVLNQKISNLDYVVFDGGSSDDTVPILQKYEGNLRWVSEKDKGQTHAVNKGIIGTDGEIIGWLNSDDIYYPGAVSKVLEIFELNPDVDIIYGHAHHIDEHDNFIEEYYTENWDYEKFKSVCFVSQPATFFRRSVVEKFGLLDEKLQYCMDYEYWIRLAENGVKFHYCPEIIAGSRLYANTKTMGATVKVHTEINDMLKKNLKKVPDRWVSNLAHVKLRSLSLQDSHYLFPLAVTTLSAFYSVKWNKSLSANIWYHFKSSVKNTVLGFLRGIKKR
jgi:glycosyltransferase involved in cell wall biosynthesis